MSWRSKNSPKLSKKSEGDYKEARFYSDVLSWRLILPLYIRLNELGIADSEHHPSLGPFYLEYGNGLLKCAENSNELFKFTEQSEVSQSSHQQQTINENLENMSKRTTSL